MSNQPGSKPLTRQQSDMLVQVEAILGRHVRLQGLRDRGWSLQPECDDDAIWVTATGPAGRVVEAKSRTPRWWLPPRSGRALAIAEELVDSLEQILPAEL